MPRRLTLAALLLAATTLTTPTGAQLFADPETMRRLVEDWNEDLHRAHQELLEGKSKKATRRVERIRRELLRSLRSGPATPHLLGQISFLRALAAAGAGDSDAASWDFHVATELVATYDALDLGRYGDAGMVLEQARATRRERFAREAAPRSDLDLPEVVPPRAIHAPKPDYPLVHRITCGQAKAVVRAIVDREGKPTQPTFLEHGDPILLFAALDATRLWRFEPALQNGEPVVGYYDVTFNFRLTGDCVPMEPPT